MEKHLESKLFKCNYCSHQTNPLNNLNFHIQTKYTRQGLVKCKYPGCDKEFSKRNLKRNQETHLNITQFRCTLDGYEFVTK